MPDVPDEDRERLLEDFLTGGPRSEEWRLWREALQKRLADLKRRRGELEGESEGEARELQEMIAETEAQIDALATEEVISEFVESEIDLSLNTIEKEEGFGDFGDFEDLSGDGRS